MTAIIPSTEGSDMKRLIAGCAFLVALGTSVLTQPATASPTDKYSASCDTSRKVPRTVVAVNGRTAGTIIHWESKVFDNAGFDALRRCGIVSPKINNFFKSEGKLYIKNGTMNNLPVICLTNSVDGACQETLFTLKPGQDGRKTLEKLLNIDPADVNSPGLVERTDRVIYVNLLKRIKK
jgi:Circadian oscillating protein COP23